MFQQLGCNCTTVSQVIESEDNAVFKAIQDGIDRYNARQSISNAQKVFQILTELRPPLNLVGFCIVM